MKFKKAMSVILAFAMTFTGVFGTNTIFADEENAIKNDEVQLAADVLPYQNTSLSFEERAADLVSRMTLEEKVTQLTNSAAEIRRLGVPKYQYWKEGLHGIAREGKATSFPSSLSMSNTWDRELIFQAADITSTEARGKLGAAGSRGNGLSYWSPTINMARDPRWGRNEESYGEDPYLTTQYGIGFIDGMQGNRDTDNNGYLKTIATLKHFVANNCESERFRGTSVMDEQTMRDYYAKAFQDIMEASNAASVMSSYNATTVSRNGKIIYDYKPSSANPYTLQDLLRRNWGFSGYVTGDCAAVANLNAMPTMKRSLFPDKSVKLGDIPASATIPFAIKNGNDLDCGSGFSANIVKEAVENGYLTEDDIDIALYHAFLTRMKTGEFDPAENVPYTSIKSDVLETDEHIAVAEKAAEESWVLLKNENNALPIKSNVKNVALVGNLAGETFLGGYAGTPEKTVSPYEGLVNIFKEKNMDTNVNYLGNITDTTPLINIKSLNLVKSDGTKVKVDLSKATKTDGATLSNGSLTNVTRVANVVVPSVSFSDIKNVEAEVSAGADCPSGTINIGYGSASQVYSNIPFESTGSFETYKTVSDAYKGAEGGYDQTADLYLTLSVNSDFSVEKYKASLDEADVIIAYAGTTLEDSNESNDRKNILLPASQSHVDKLTKAYPDKTIVVMSTAGQMDISSFENNTNAILWNCYNGQTQGTALAKVLLGDVNPSGKLSSTWYDPKDLDIMKLDGVDKTDEEGIKWERNDYSIRQRTSKPAEFPEGFVDNFPGRTYQYYNGNPVFPFGFGLSYTDFAYSNLSISKSSVDANGEFEVSVDVTNTGKTNGDEVVQLYIKSPNGNGVDLPLKQLKGFERVSLSAGQTKTVTMKVKVPDLHFYNEETTGIYVPVGEYTVMVGGNSKLAENLTGKINVTGELKKELKRVSALPTSVTLVSTVNPDGSYAQAVKTVDPKLQAIMSDENFIDMSTADVSYTSNNEAVAVVENGMVRANNTEGVALITAAVTVDGVTKETSFPVVSTIKNAISDAQRAEFKTSVENAYKSYDSSAYSEKNWGIITDIYNKALKAIETEIDYDALQATINDSLAKMSSIKLKPADGVDIYEISKFTNTLYNEVEVEVKYNGDEAEPTATLIASVLDENGKIKRTTETTINDSGKYTINDKFTGGEKLDIHIWDSFTGMVPFSKKYEHTYTEQEKPNFVVYNFSDDKFAGYYDSTAESPLAEVEGLKGYGAFATSKPTWNYTYEKADGTKVPLTFKKGLQGGTGGATKSCLYFDPFPGYTSCKVTVVYYNAGKATETNEGKKYRKQYLGQLADDGKNMDSTAVTGSAEPESFLAFSQTFTDMSKPIYTWGGGSNKGVYAVIVEYFK